MNDALGRPLRNLRLSVTDRCNLRCEYCMPEDDYAWLPREDVLHFEEISPLVDVFMALGVDKVRLTGGEPLLRRDLALLVGMLAAKTGLHDLALTTNGILLADQIDALKIAGLQRLTVSLDTLQRSRFEALTRFDRLDAVHAGIAAAQRVFGALKIDSVVMRGVNDDELVSLIEYGRSVNAEVRFIEYMDVGGASRWAPDRVVTRSGDSAGAVATLRCDRTASARHPRPPPSALRLPDGTTFGIISSTTEPFCRTLRPQPADRRRHVVSCASTRRAASICAARCAAAPRPTNCGRSSRRAGRGAPIAAPRNGSRWVTGAPSSRCRIC